MIKTDRAVTREHPDALKGAPGYDGPGPVLYGADDIFADGTEIVRRRFPLTSTGFRTRQATPTRSADSMHAYPALHSRGHRPSAQIDPLCATVALRRRGDRRAERRFACMDCYYRWAPAENP